MNMSKSASKKEHLFSRIKDCFFIINVTHTKTLVCSSLLDEIGWFKNNRQIYFQYIVYYIYIYIQLYIYANLYVYVFAYIFKFTSKCYSQSTPSSAWRQPRPGNASSADKQTCNYDTECSNHLLPLSILRSKRLSRSKMKWRAVYTNLPANYIYICYIYNI